MKNTLLSSFCLIGIVAGSLTSALAQTASPTPAPTAAPTATPAVGSVYLDYGQPDAARIADAQAVIAAPGTDAATIGQATWVMDGLLLWDVKNQAAWTASGSQLASQIIAAQGQMTPGMSTFQSFDLLWAAIHATETWAYTNFLDRVTYLQGVVNALTGSEPAYYTLEVQSLLAWDHLGAANVYVSQGSYGAALTQLGDPSLLATNYGRDVIALTARIKALTRASDALAWAKAQYVASAFQDSQAGINAVTAALRATDLNLARANAFIAAQADATQPNVLASTPIPTVLQGGPLPMPGYAVFDAGLRGDNVGALKAAMGYFVSANTNNGLNSAVAGIAAALRNTDGNLVRANAFIAAQKAGTAYPIAELQ